jgi:hypothetical protein
MKYQSLNPVSLTWTYERFRLSAETIGLPIEELVMDCKIAVKRNGDFDRVSAKALWDTGTSTTVITPGIAAKLGLEPDEKSYIDLNVVGGVIRAWMTVVYVLFPNGKGYGPIPVAVRELPSADVLLGMDVISIGTFTLRRKPDGGSLFTFEF